MRKLPLRWTLSSRRAAYAVAAAALVALLALTYLPAPAPRALRLRVEDLPALFVEAAQGLNHSLKLLELSTRQGVNASSHAGRMREVALLLRNATELGELQVSELGQRLLEASGNYSDLAMAASRIAEAAQALSSAREQLRGFLEGVRACDFGRAKRAAPALRAAAEEALGGLSSALQLLAGVREEGLLSDSHRELLRRAESQVAKWVKALSNLARAAEVVERADQAALERACRARGSGGFGGDVVGLAQSLEPSESGEFAYEVALVKSYVLGKQRESGTGVGPGAGWGEPAGDD